MGNESLVVYVWDTNVFIDLKKRYPEDRFPTLWNKIRELAKEGRIRIHEKVFEELKNYGKKDEARKLAEELRKFRKEIFVPITEYQLNKIPEILDKLRQIGGNKGQKFRNIADDWEENDAADVYLIAYILEENNRPTIDEWAGTKRVLVITTEDGGLRDAAKLLYGIDSITLVNLMREEGWTF